MASVADADHSRVRWSRGGADEGGGTLTVVGQTNPLMPARVLSQGAIALQRRDVLRPVLRVRQPGLPRPSMLTVPSGFSLVIGTTKVGFCCAVHLKVIAGDAVVVVDEDLIGRHKRTPGADAVGVCDRAVRAERRGRGELHIADHGSTIQLVAARADVPVERECQSRARRDRRVLNGEVVAALPAFGDPLRPLSRP